MKSGSGIAFSIPKVFLKEGLIKENVEYEITIVEAKKEQNTTNSEEFTEEEIASFPIRSL